MASRNVPASIDMNFKIQCTKNNLAYLPVKFKSVSDAEYFSAYRAEEDIPLYKKNVPKTVLKHSKQIPLSFALRVKGNPKLKL